MDKERVFWDIHEHLETWETGQRALGFTNFEWLRSLNYLEVNLAIRFFLDWKSLKENDSGSSYTLTHSRIIINVS